MITVADAILHAFDHGQPMAPITDSDPGFDLPRAYQAQAMLTATRLRRGARVVGMKTGFTYAAGNCLVCSASVDGKERITVVLKSARPEVSQDSKALLHWSLGLEMLGPMD